MIKKFLNWLDPRLLKIGVIFLIFFIPLYPKFPLFDIRHTWVYIRLDDLAIAFITAIFGIQLIRRKATLKTPLTLPIALYWIIGLMTTIFALIFIVGHIPNIFPSLVILHYLRRIEYMIVFFIAFNSVRHKKDLFHYGLALVLTVLAIVIYSLGQRLAGFPAILTMNEEFAKGMFLYLPPTARLTATFAGHYDLAAYLVLTIPILATFLFTVRNWFGRIGIFLITLSAYVVLLFTESRVSIACYMLAITLALWMVKKKWLIIPVLIVSIVLMNLVSGSSERLYQTFRIRKVVFNLDTGQPIASVQEIDEETGTAIAESQAIGKEKLPVGTGFIGLPDSNKAEKNTGGGFPSGGEKGEVPVKTRKEKRTNIKTVYFKKYLAEELEGTTSGEISTVSGNFYIRKALVYDISFTTRFQGEWPRAIEAFKRNFLLGSGFSTISLATDNDYLRMLGETGILGVLTFFLIFFTLADFIKRASEKVKDKRSINLGLGVLAGVTGLGFNAVLIDVIEASKVAYTMWLFIGLVLGALYLFYPKKLNLIKEIKLFLFSNPMVISGILIIAVAFFVPLLKNYFVGDDYTWLRWASESTVEDLSLFFTEANGFFYRPIQKLFYFIMFNVFWLTPQNHHYISLAAHLGVSVGLYLLVLKLTRNRFQAIGASFIFLFLSSNAESVFWLSSLGNQLANFFVIWSLYLYIIYRTDKKMIFFPLAFVSCFLAMLSYEGGVIAPILIVFWEILQKNKEDSFRQKFTKLILPVLLLSQILIYTFLRNFANAHGLSGDYNYNWIKLPANIIGNLAGYLGVMAFGPEKALFWYDNFRFIARSNLPLFLFIAFSFCLFSFIVLIVMVKKIRMPGLLIFILGYLFITLLPFLGLGNISLRYSYMAAPGFAILTILLLGYLYRLFEKKSIRLAGLTVLVIWVLILVYNISQLRKISQDWLKAGKIAKDIVLTVKENYFPIHSSVNQLNFFFVNIPIRYQQAWVFPVGLEDALWHTFQDSRLKVYQPGSVEEAFILADDKSNPHVFLFNQGKLGEVKKTKIEKTIIEEYEVEVPIK